EILYQKSVLYNNFILDFIIKGSEYNYIADTKYKEIYNNDNGYEKDDIKQLSGYGRVESIVKEFTNDIENYVPKCLIIYPSDDSNNKSIDFEKKEQISGLVKFYKLGIYLPRL
ncbi:restriction endonuclease, partial [Brachyspira catarrhinii]